ncbi:phosphatase [Paenibacillus xerothermodurans]|uniref:Phosphatase n=2 Tax=Paenibacillus xerothermodurans TaxID=1977292 RepID=A0A2W1NRR0_PAEXE|nr:phosphatase [Paenibacillus xerothermodurans]
MAGHTPISAKREKNPSFQFGLIADVQYCDCDTNNTRFYRESPGKLAEAAKLFNKHDLAFTIQLGDIIDRDAASFEKIVPMYNQINGPKYHVLGNHDFPVASDKVVGLLGMTKQYYDFSRDGWRFVVLDTNDISTYANAEGTTKHKRAQDVYDVLKWAGAPNAETWNGGLGSEQMDWLRGVLQRSAQAGEKVVVIGHMPIYPKNMHNVWNDEAVRQLLESSPNVVAYFNGHNHEGNYERKNGIHYVNFQGMVETKNTNAYSIVRVFPDRLEIDGYGREPDRVLELRNDKIEMNDHADGSENAAARQPGKDNH